MNSAQETRLGLSPAPFVKCGHCQAWVGLSGMELREGLKYWTVPLHHLEESVCTTTVLTGIDDEVAAQVRSGFYTIRRLREERRREAWAQLDRAREAIAAAAAVGIEVIEMVSRTGYSERAVEGWIRRARSAKQSAIPPDWRDHPISDQQTSALVLLVGVRAQRDLDAKLEQNHARLAEGVIVWARRCEIPAEEAAACLSYNLATVQRWYAKVEAAQARAAEQLRLRLQRNSVAAAKRARGNRAAQSRTHRARTGAKNQRRGKRRRRG